MPLLAECPVCRQPLRWTYLIRPLWSQWSCRWCGSLLGIDRKRRLLSILTMAFALPVSMYLTRRGWPDFIAAPVVLAVWLPSFLLLDRAVVLERHGFRCKHCGYDLRGQVAPRCPECGREFDAAERTFLQTGLFPHAPVRRRSRAWLAIVVLLIGATLAGLAVGITHYKMTKGRAARRAALATQPSGQAAGRAPVRQPRAADRPTSAAPASDEVAAEPRTP